MKGFVIVLGTLVSAAIFSIAPLLIFKLWSWVSGFALTNDALDGALALGLLAGIFGGLIVGISLSEELQ